MLPRMLLSDLLSRVIGHMSDTNGAISCLGNIKAPVLKGEVEVKGSGKTTELFVCVEQTDQAGGGVFTGLLLLLLFLLFFSLLHQSSRVKCQPSNTLRLSVSISFSNTLMDYYHLLLLLWTCSLLPGERASITQHRSEREREREMKACLYQTGAAVRLFQASKIDLPITNHLFDGDVLIRGAVQVHL